jgi:tetratricopeptide (TPR) repeat protein
VTVRRWRAQALAELGRFDEAAPLAREAIEIARTRNHPYALANAINSWGLLCVRQGNFERAIPLLEEGLQVSRTLGFQGFVPVLGDLLAEARAQIGCLAEAQVLLDEVPASHRVGFDFPIPRLLTLMLLGRLADAKAPAATALPEAREGGERGTEAWLLWLLGELAARESPGEVGAAADRFSQALALVDTVGMRPLVAHCHLGLGKLYRRTGDRQQAHEHLTTATTMYREMDMRFYLDQGEAEIGALG